MSDFERDVLAVMLAVAHGEKVTFIGPDEAYTKRVMDEAKRRFGLTRFEPAPGHNDGSPSRPLEAGG